MIRAAHSHTTSGSLLHVFSTFRVGGPQVRFAGLANHFGQKYKHFVVAMDGALDAKELLNEDIDVTFLAIKNNKTNFLSNLRRFRQTLRQIQPDLLVTYNWGAIEWALAKWMAPVPHVHIEDGFGPEEAVRQLPRRVWIRRCALRNSAVVVPSKVLLKIAIETWKLNAKTVRYLPNGIDVDRFADLAVEPLLARDTVPVIGTVTALRKEKNLSRLLEAFRIVRDRIPCRLVIAGDGSERITVQAQAAALGLEKDVVFTGYRADTERVYAAMDIFALSSDTEQMPTSVLEAMAAGLPIVSTDVGDVRAMVANENLPFVVAKSAEALARGLLELLQNPWLGKQIGLANRAIVEREYSQKKMFDAYEALFVAPASRTSE